MCACAKRVGSQDILWKSCTDVTKLFLALTSCRPTPLAPNVATLLFCDTQVRARRR